MWIRTVDYFLAGIGFAGHVLLLVLLVRRKLVARIPLFAILIGFYALRFAVSLLLSPVAAPVAWTLAGVDPLLQCGVFIALVLGWRRLAGRGRLLSALILAGAFTVAATISWYAGPSSHFSLRNLFIKAGILVSVLWLEAAFGVLASLHFRGFLLARPTRQIVLGFALYSGTHLVADFGREHLQAIGGMTNYLVLSWLPVAAYLGCLAIWIRACAGASADVSGQRIPVLAAAAGGA